MSRALLTQAWRATRRFRRPWRPLLKALPEMLRRASLGWVDDNAPRLGASVAFYSLLSLAPMIVIAIAVAAAVYGHDAAQGRLAAEIRGFAGADMARTIEEILKGAYQPRSGMVATLAGLGTLAFAASSMFVELHDALNTIWNVPAPRDRSHTETMVRMIRDRFYSFVTVVGIGFLLLASLVLNVWIGATRMAVPPAITFLILYPVITVLFAALYKVVPDVELRWSDVSLGAMMTSLLFLTGKELMGLYFANTSFGPSYSAAGSPIVVLLWVYYSAQLFFWGAEFTKVYARTLGSWVNKE